MAVLERPELEASPLADLHAIANQIGLDGFRRLRKADLIDAILGEPAASKSDDAGDGEEDGEEREPTARKRGPARSRRAKSTQEDAPAAKAAEEDADTTSDEPSGARRGRGDRSSTAARARRGERAPTTSAAGEDRTAEGIVELLGNGSAFLRVDPPDPSDDDVYISAAQVRRCELVSGDRVSGPVRTPRRSERYPSLARVDTINGVPADAVAEGTRYDELPVAYPSERLELDAKDATLKAIEWLTPIGRGSRALIVGAARAGKTETLKRILGALAGREGLEVSLVLSGVRPEEISEWRQGPVVPAVTLSFAASADSQSQAVEHVIETAKRVAARGGDALVLIDSLDGLQPHAARKVLAAARKLEQGGSLTVIATATRPLGGETTVIALDVALTSSGRLPALDLINSGTVKPELLVGETEAKAIAKERAKALAG